MSIFISCAAYRDTELPKTIRSAIDNADYPNELHFGIVSQDLNNKHPNLDHINNLRQVNIHAKDARGAGYARKIAMDLYDGQDFFMQIDSHMRFVEGWDSKLIAMYNWCVNDADTYKIILSQFPAPYFVGSDGKDYFPENDNMLWNRPSIAVPYNNFDGSWVSKRLEMDKSHPQKSFTVLAGFIFAHGSIVKEVPYDERISFMGEEICFALRSYTRGWEIYAPHEMVIYHFYVRERMPKVWNNGVRKKSWMSIEKDSSDVQKNVLLAKEEGVYGVADYDRYFEFQTNAGLDFYEFYHSDVMGMKVNKSIIVEEIDFSEIGARTVYCIEGMHDECESTFCECECHKEAK